MKKSEWIYLPVEVQVREFDSRLLLACCAAEKGYEVVLGKKRDLAGAYKYFPRGLLVDKSISVRRGDQFSRLKENGFDISVSEEESQGAYANPESFLNWRMSSTNLRLIDCYFSWGRMQSELIKSRYPESSDKVLTVGSPRFDLCRMEYRRLFQEAVSDITRKYGKVILFNSIFSSVLNYRGGRSFHRQLLERVGAITDSASAEYYEGKFDHLQKNFRHCGNVFRIVTEAFPEHTLIIRPHPGDDRGLWRELIDRIPNAEVVHEGNIIPWLIAADGIFHHGSTSAVESQLLGKACISFLPYYNSTYDDWLPNQIGPVAYDTDQLIGYLQDAISGRELKYQPVADLGDYIFTDKRLASDRIVEVILNKDYPKDRLLRPLRIGKYLLSLVNARAKEIRKRVRSRGVANSTLGSEQSMWRDLSEHDVKKRLQILREASGRFSDLTVRRITKQIFVVRKEATHN
ncbi:surface carbohydrate biosynthesis protein [Spiribacter sp. 218]|uniref:surface carbohydrate biosynthesis protein n=1 Tax=Spiribacter pallidus TaxID=1987936 RepID=UPI00349F14D6